VLASAAIPERAGAFEVMSITSRVLTVVSEQYRLAQPGVLPFDRENRVAVNVNIPTLGNPTPEGAGGGQSATELAAIL
jgi:hypothetical protein